MTKSTFAVFGTAAVITVSVLLLAPAFSLAAADSCPGGELTKSGICLPKPPSGSPTGIDTLSQLIIRVLNIALTTVGLISVLFVVMGGFQYVTAAGDEEKIKKAKGTIVSALIGLGIVLLALTIVRIVANLTQGPSGI